MYKLVLIYTAGNKKTLVNNRGQFLNHLIIWKYNYERLQHFPLYNLLAERRNIVCISQKEYIFRFSQHFLLIIGSYWYFSVMFYSL